MPLFEYLQRLGDDRLILGHRLSEWCGHAPILEEDIALANIALDMIGQANLLLQLAGREEGKGRDQDALAFFRNEVEFRNAHLAELPNGDFAVTIVRQFFFSVYSVLLWEQLQHSSHPDLAGIAAKALKESRYHVRHAGEWVVRLGDGTVESSARAQAAVDALWRFTPELFDSDEVERRLVAAHLACDSSALRAPWLEQVSGVLVEARLTQPADAFPSRGGRVGRHTEYLGHLLAEMQIVARSHPGAQW